MFRRLQQLAFEAQLVIGTVYRHGDRIAPCGRRYATIDDGGCNTIRYTKDNNRRPLVNIIYKRTDCDNVCKGVVTLRYI